MRKRSKRTSYNIFLAVSYSAACTYEQEYRYLLESITTAFESIGLHVYLAPLEEDWGDSRPPRAVGIRKDIRALRSASRFILFLNGNESDGALVELGMALGFGKQIWILRRRSEALPSYLLGLWQLQFASIRDIDHEQDIKSLVHEVQLCSSIMG